ncbi:lasso peptide biosynthesis B2 protein [Planktotalea sp.]|uniref:lasso peptide biosynthesis B2 protein n=1 Tax=Planktotalea sp. TaxID=2029877 RepID=UPI003D6B7D43
MSFLATASRKWTSFWSYGLIEHALILPAFCLLGIARLMILCLPFRGYVAVFGKRSEAKNDILALPERSQNRARAIGKAIRMTAKRTPWHSVCLPQAICACILLRLFRIPYHTRFGVMPDTKNDMLTAHVWVTAGTCVVTGGAAHGGHTVVASFQFRD